MNFKYIYDSETDLYKKINVPEEMYSNDDTVNYLSFNNVDDGLTVINDLITLYKLFNDPKYLIIEQLAIQKLKHLTNSDN